MKKLLSIILVICMLISVVSITASAETEEFISEHLYEYYSENNVTDTPDWYMYAYTTNEVEPCGFFTVCGDYYFWGYNMIVPNAVPYYIYVPEENKTYHISTAVNNDLEGIDKAFTEYLLKKDTVGMIGDFDGDDKLTVFDATGIQRALAGMAEFRTNDQWEKGVYISDKDQDGQRTVLDATAIQRHLAGLE